MSPASLKETGRAGWTFWALCGAALDVELKPGDVRVMAAVVADLDEAKPFEGTLLTDDEICYLAGVTRSSVGERLERLVGCGHLAMSTTCLGFDPAGEKRRVIRAAEAFDGKGGPG